MARWCLVTGQTPDVWRQLDRLERRAFITALKQLARK